MLAATWLLPLAGGYDSAYRLLHLLTPVARGCPASSGTLIPSTAPSSHVDVGFCETLLPKVRQCVAYSFGIGGVWDFDKAMAARNCRVRSFDPICCGGSHIIGPAHEFVPLSLSIYDGLVAPSAATGNATASGLTLKSLVTGFGDRLDLLRMSVRLPNALEPACVPRLRKPRGPSRSEAAVDGCAQVSSKYEWKVLRALMDSPALLKSVPQLLLNLHLSDPTSFDLYADVLGDLKASGFVPFYVARQPTAEYLQIQEGTKQLWSRWEVSMGNTRR